MKPIHINKRDIIFGIVLLVGINQAIIGGPYVKLCRVTICQYLHAASQYGMCTGDTKDLYAVNPDPPEPSIPCDGTRQWYGEIYGYHCHGTCHTGWYITALDGGTSNVYTVTQQGKYWCTVDCGDGAFNTDTIEFFYDSDVPVIAFDPISQTICQGQSVTFSVNAYSSSNYIFYNWEKKPAGDYFSNLNVTTKSFTFTPPASDDMSQYRCLVYNACGYVYSGGGEGALLDIKFKPSVSQNPSDISVCAGSTGNFSVGVTGDNLTYQWQLSTNQGSSWGNISTSGQYIVNDDQLSVLNIAANMSGYLYRCTISGYCAPGVTSSNAALEVKTSPVIISSPLSIQKCVGDSAIFKVQTTGTEPMEYYWRKDEGSGSWSASNKFVIPAVSEGDAGSYDVLVRNECNVPGIESNNATLTIYPLPGINLGADKHICEGSETVLDAGANMIGYKWSTGQTSRTINVNSGGEYSVTVTNNNNCTNDDTINIFLDPQLPSLYLGDDIIKCLGETAVLSAGQVYDNYLWNTQAITATISVTEPGDYSVIASNSGNVCTTSDSIHVDFSSPFEDEEIGMVTVDLESGDNLVVWERTPGKGTEYYEIYRGSSGNETFLGRVDFEALTVFRDVGTFDDGMSYRYEILVVDSCGNKSQYSNSHKTMHLTASKGVANEVNLAWNHYEGFPVAWYYIYRGTDSAHLQLYDSIQYDPTTTVKTDYNPPVGVAYYRIGVKAPKVYLISSLNKSDSGPYSHSMSNIEDNRFQTGFDKINDAGELIIYPNPSGGSTTISFPNSEQKQYQLSVRDLSGKIVLVIDNITQDKVIIEGGSLKAGYYVVEMIGDHIYRSKLIIE